MFTHNARSTAFGLITGLAMLASSIMGFSSPTPATYAEGLTQETSPAIPQVVGNVWSYKTAQETCGPQALAPGRDRLGSHVVMWELEWKGQTPEYVCHTYYVGRPFADPLRTPDPSFKKLGDQREALIWGATGLPFLDSDRPANYSQWIEQNDRNPRYVVSIQSIGYARWYDYGNACPLHTEQNNVGTTFYYVGSTPTAEHLAEIWHYDASLDAFVLDAAPADKQTLRVPTFGTLHVSGGVAEQGGEITTNKAIFSCYPRPTDPTTSLTVGLLLTATR